MTPLCSVEGCERGVLRKGFCKLHWERILRKGEPGPVHKYPTLPLIVRFCSKLIWTPTCVEWNGFKNKDGYGRYRVAGKQLYAHRLSYELFVGPIPDEMTIDHLCENHACVWPEHLEPVSRSENAKRYHANHQITHCINGHELTPETTYVLKNGWRKCAICYRANARRAYWRKVSS